MLLSTRRPPILRPTRSSAMERRLRVAFILLTPALRGFPYTMPLATIFLRPPRRTRARKTTYPCFALYPSIRAFSGRDGRVQRQMAGNCRYSHARRRSRKRITSVCFFCHNSFKYLSKYLQFLENDRKVLRFKAYHDDPTPYGARTYVVVHYFLADNTMEVNHLHCRNS